jgi:hypothetical protein
MTSGATTKPKYVPLKKVDIEQIDAAFRAPLIKSADEKRDAARIGSGRAIYDAAFPTDAQKAIKTLSTHCLTKGVTSLYVDTGTGYRTRVQLGNTYQIVEHYSCAPKVAVELVSAAEEIERLHAAELDNIAKMAASVKSAALAFRTRHDFGQAWAPLYDLMGAPWVDAVAITANTLPAVVDLARATSALTALRQAA